MVVLVMDPSADSDVFIEAWDGKDVDWNRAFGKFNAAVDWPSSTFYKQLMEVYPDAKVIHTTRDAEKWYTSVVNTIMPASTMMDKPGIPAHVANRHRMIKHVIWDGEVEGEKDKETMVRKFKEHDEDVKNYVPAERLLWFETGVDGWDKLCAFLGKDVPDIPWPHVNKTEDFKVRINSMGTGAPISDLSPVK
ncbi:unnamed protein product [Umbelopsis ramanniana]